MEKEYYRLNSLTNKHGTYSIKYLQKIQKHSKKIIHYFLISPCVILNARNILKDYKKKYSKAIAKINTGIIPNARNTPKVSKYNDSKVIDKIKLNRE